MRENLIELIAQTALTGVYLVGAGLATIVGLLAESRGVLFLLAGDYRMAGYLMFVGIVGLGFGYLFVRDKLVTQIAKWT